MMNLCRKNWTQNVSKRINKGKEIEKKGELKRNHKNKTKRSKGEEMQCIIGG